MARKAKRNKSKQQALPQPQPQKSPQQASPLPPVQGETVTNGIHEAPAAAPIPVAAPAARKATGKLQVDTSQYRREGEPQPALEAAESAAVASGPVSDKLAGLTPRGDALSSPNGDDALGDTFIGMISGRRAESTGEEAVALPPLTSPTITPRSSAQTSPSRVRSLSSNSAMLHKTEQNRILRPPHKPESDALPPVSGGAATATAKATATATATATAATAAPGPMVPPSLLLAPAVLVATTSAPALSVHEPSPSIASTSNSTSTSTSTSTAAAATTAAEGEGENADGTGAAAATGNGALPTLPEDDFIRYFVKRDEAEPGAGAGAGAATGKGAGGFFLDALWQDLGVDDEQDQAFSSKNASVEDDVFNFIRVPLEVEKLMLFGFFLCTDSLLFVLVFLPLRILRALLLLVGALVLPSGVLQRRPGLRFHRTQLYDLLRGSIIVVAFLVLLQVHMSRIYHYVRGQAFIKLYVIFNMLDIFDRLMCSFGQDIMDSLFYVCKTSPHAYSRIAFRFVLGTVYATLHSLLYFVRLITLNAAINSTSNALMTILISNNFVELKSSVFKRFAEANLFQIACSDMVERFELFIFLALTAMQSSDSWEDFFYGSAMYVFACELLVDWIKHAFITKFNRIHFSCYGNFLEALCRDIAPSGGAAHKHPYAASQRLGGRPVDATQAVAQRIGLATLPLTCVVLRILFVNAPERLRSDPLAPPNALFLVLGFLCLLALKTFINCVLRGRACSVLMSRERQILHKSSPRLASMPSTPTEKELQKAVVAKHMQKIDQLAGIRRYQIFKSRVPL